MIVSAYALSEQRVIGFSLVEDIGLLKDASVANHCIYVDRNGLGFYHLFLNRLEPSGVCIELKEIVEVDEKRVGSLEVLPIPSYHHEIDRPITLHTLPLLLTVVSQLGLGIELEIHARTNIRVNRLIFSQTPKEDLPTI